MNKEIASVLLRNKVIRQIVNERSLQVEKWGDSHDDDHYPGDLAGAGVAYALNAASLMSPVIEGHEDGRPPIGWCWDSTHWKPETDVKNVRAELIKAAALIVAEIEKMDRVA